jgi:hypothetical protein
MMFVTVCQEFDNKKSLVANAYLNGTLEDSGISCQHHECH